MLEASWISAYEVGRFENETVIKFLKKELIKKTYCRQVMKRQYRELKQKYNSLLEKSKPTDTKFAEFVKNICN